MLTLIAEGRSNQAVSDRLGLSPKTVEAHIRAIFMKLGLEEARDDHRRVLAVLAWLRCRPRSRRSALHGPLTLLTPDC